VVFCTSGGGCPTAQQGSSYIAAQAATGAQDPSNSTFWHQIAAAGANGTNGAAGATGATGPSGAGSSGGLPYGGVISGTISATTNNLYSVAEGGSVTLPPASTTAGQQLMLVDFSCSTSNSGFTVHTTGSDTMILATNAASYGTSKLIYCQIFIVSNGSNKWLAMYIAQ